VNSFVFLSKNKFYDGVTFIAVAEQALTAQGRDPSGTGWALVCVHDELDPTLTFDKEACWQWQLGVKHNAASSISAWPRPDPERQAHQFLPGIRAWTVKKLAPRDRK